MQRRQRVEQSEDGWRQAPGWRCVGRAQQVATFVAHQQGRARWRVGGGLSEDHTFGCQRDTVGQPARQSRAPERRLTHPRIVGDGAEPARPRRDALYHAAAKSARRIGPAPCWRAETDAREVGAREAIRHRLERQHALRGQADRQQRHAERWQGAL